MAFHQDELLCDLVECFRLVESSSVLGAGQSISIGKTSYLIGTVSMLVRVAYSVSER